MNTYYLESSQADRIRFDEAVYRYADDVAQHIDLEDLEAASKPLGAVAEAYFEDFMTSLEVDDMAEARARFHYNFSDRMAQNLQARIEAEGV